MSTLRRLGCVTKLLFVAVCAGILFFAVVALTEPWALHIGEHWTPFTWFGYGKLVTKGGAEYPLFVLFYLDNPSKARGTLGASSPVQGNAWLCTSPGVAQPLQLEGGLHGTGVRTQRDAGWD